MTRLNEDPTQAAASLSPGEGALIHAFPIPETLPCVFLYLPQLLKQNVAAPMVHGAVQAIRTSVRHL
jgi:hypothetical protein